MDFGVTTGLWPRIYTSPASGHRTLAGLWASRGRGWEDSRAASSAAEAGSLGEGRLQRAADKQKPGQWVRFWERWVPADLQKPQCRSLGPGSKWRAEHIGESQAACSPEEASLTDAWMASLEERVCRGAMREGQRCREKQGVCTHQPWGWSGPLSAQRQGAQQTLNTEQGWDMWLCACVCVCVCAHVQTCVKDPCVCKCVCVCEGFWMSVSSHEWSGTADPSLWWLSEWGSCKWGVETLDDGGEKQRACMLCSWKLQCQPCVDRGHMASVLKVNHSGQFRSRKALSFTSFLLGPLGLIPEATELLLNLFHCGCLVAKSCLTLCDPMNCNTQGFPVLQSLQDFVQTHVHGVSDAIQPSHTLLPPSPPALDLS